MGCLLQESLTNDGWPLTNHDAAVYFLNVHVVSWLVLDQLICYATTEYVHAVLAVNANTSAWFSNITDYQNLIRLYFLIS